VTSSGKYNIRTFNQLLVVNSHTTDPASKMKMIQMILVEVARVRVNFKCIITKTKMKYAFQQCKQ